MSYFGLKWHFAYKYFLEESRERSIDVEATLRYFKTKDLKIM